MRRTTLQALPLLVALLLFTPGGCGFYTFSGAVPGHLQSVAISSFENQTAEFGLAEDLTDGLVERFTREGTLKVRDQDRADSVIRGTLVRIIDVPSTFNADESVEEYKITLVVQASYEDLVKGKVVWEERLSNFGIYPFGGGSQAAREDGIEEAIDKLVEDILNKTVSGW